MVREKTRDLEVMGLKPGSAVTGFVQSLQSIGESLGRLVCLNHFTAMTSFQNDQLKYEI